MTGFLECGRIACGRGRGRSGNKRRPCSGGEFIEDGVEGRGGRGVFIEDGAEGRGGRTFVEDGREERWGRWRGVPNSFNALTAILSLSVFCLLFLLMLQ